MGSLAIGKNDPLLHAGQAPAEEVQIPQSSTRGWFFEILAMVASFACMASIVAILAVMDDRPLTEWHFFFSIPATVAIFGTALKSTAAFAVAGCVSQYKWLHFKSSPRKLVDLDLIDDASRGPLGALVLLARRPMGLASIAAAVTLLALAVETFVQQTVTFTPRNVLVDDGEAVLGLAHTYDGGARPIGSSGGIINLSPSTVDLSMQGAVYRGLFRLDSPAVFNCTSSCRWNGRYTSLGFASNCSDVTEATLNLPPGAEPSDLDKDRNLTTPGGVKLDASYSATSWQTAISVRAISLLDPEMKMVNDEMTGSLSPNIARIGVLRADVGYSWTIQTDTIEIVECDIRLAAHSYYDVSSTGNKLFGKQDVINLNRGRVTFVDGGSHADKLIFNESGLPVLQAKVPDIVALSVLFTSSRFSGNIFDGETAPTQNSSGMGDAFRSGSIAKTVQDMVDSMTNQLRASFDVKERGLTTKQVVFVQVRWPWLALPLIVQLFSAVFIVFVLVQSSQTKTLPLWKSSATAVLTYDIRQDEFGVGKLGTGVLSKKELKTLAESVNVKLELPEQMMTTAAGMTDSGNGHKEGFKRSQYHVFPLPEDGGI